MRDGDVTIRISRESWDRRGMLRDYTAAHTTEQQINELIEEVYEEMLGQKAAALTVIRRMRAHYECKENTDGS